MTHESGSPTAVMRHESGMLTMLYNGRLSKNIYKHSKAIHYMSLSPSLRSTTATPRAVHYMSLWDYMSLGLHEAKTSVG